MGYRKGKTVMEKFKTSLAVVWDWTKYIVASVVTAPVSFYEYVKNYPGQVVILWPLSVALAIWLF